MPPHYACRGQCLVYHSPVGFLGISLYLNPSISDVEVLTRVRSRRSHPYRRPSVFVFIDDAINFVTIARANVRELFPPLALLYENSSFVEASVIVIVPNREW